MHTCFLTIFILLSMYVGKLSWEQRVVVSSSITPLTEANSAAAGTGTGPGAISLSAYSHSHEVYVTGEALSHPSNTNSNEDTTMLHSATDPAPALTHSHHHNTTANDTTSADTNVFDHNEAMMMEDAMNYVTTDGLGSGGAVDVTTITEEDAKKMQHILLSHTDNFNDEDGPMGMDMNI